MNLNDIINKTKSEKIDQVSWCNTLLSILRDNHFWPAIQIKKYYNNNNLLLLHNTYERKDIKDFKELYHECKSVILDFSNPDVILHKTNSIHETISVDKYHIIKNQNDTCKIAFDGTIFYVYFIHNNWFFSTNSCTNINYSKFKHKTKSFGNMLDETLSVLLNQSENIRTKFTDLLDTNIVYTFSILHFENINNYDYQTIFGDNYKKLVFINSKNKFTDIEVDFNLHQLNIINPKKYENIEEALNKIDDIYGLILNNKYKISNEKIIFKENTNYGYHNEWRNMLWVYLQNKNNFHINDYIKQYNLEIELPLDQNNNTLDPTYLIHTVISTIKDILFNLYTTTTTYYQCYNRFKMSKDIDSKLAPILQYHLAQLRYKQITIYKNKTITNKEIFYYICHNNPIKNLLNLISFFAKNQGFDMSQKNFNCFIVLNNLLN